MTLNRNMDKAFTANEMATIRSETKEAMKMLEAKPTTPTSWILGGTTVVDSNGHDNRSDRCRYFDTNGFLKIDQFADNNEVSAFRAQMESLAEQWDPSAGIDSFGTNSKENSARGDYFLESASKVHFFAETSALLDGDNNNNNNNRELKPQYQADKLSALNKAGHAMHMIPGAFQDYALSDKIRSLALELGWKDPVVPQSMYIFKQQQIGGTVMSHQDSTFLYTCPKQSCLGLWLALHDATLENGCLWVRPESHWERTRRQYKRNPLHFGAEAIANRSNDAKGDLSLPKFVMEEIQGTNPIPWDGSIPSSDDGNVYNALTKAGFIPVECKAGDLLAFNGELDHLSLPNFSDKPRHTFQLHLVQGEKAGVTWSESNWLQCPPDTSFMRLL